MDIMTDQPTPAGDQVEPFDWWHPIPDEHLLPPCIHDDLYEEYPWDAIDPLPDTSLPWGTRSLELLHDPADITDPGVTGEVEETP